MTAQSNYKTTANGTIDYAFYTQRAHELRSQDAWKAIKAVRNALKVVAASFKRRAGNEVEPVSKSPTRKPMRSPVSHHVAPKTSQAIVPAATETQG